MRRFLLPLLLLLCCGVLAQPPAQELAKAELAQLIPASYFFAGQTATTQIRNSGGVRFADHKMILLALVDNSGYSSGVAQKYQGLLITEVPLQIGGKTVPPGSYGFGLPAPDHMGVLDINANEIAGENTSELPADQRPVPLHVTGFGGRGRGQRGKTQFHCDQERAIIMIDSTKSI